MPTLYIIAGCNGAGKTTASYTLFPEILNCKEFVNADEIAKGLSPFQPESVSFQAGRIMLERIKFLINQQVDFAFETTLSTKSYLPLIKEAKSKGYSVVLFFFWLDSADLAKERVKERVLKGGHSIPQDIIERRYHRGLKNLPIFLAGVDSWFVGNNSGKNLEIISRGGKEIEIVIFNDEIWDRIKSYE
jgi:predicted ABC-type ATPase